jgi:hypothetical protein
MEEVMNLEILASRMDARALTGRHSDAVAFDDGSGIRADVSHAFGSGGALLYLSMEIDGVEVREVLDLRPLLEMWAEEIRRDTTRPPLPPSPGAFRSPLGGNPNGDG